MPKAVISDLSATQGWKSLEKGKLRHNSTIRLLPTLYRFLTFVLTFSVRFLFFLSLEKISIRFRPIRSVDVPYRSLNVLFFFFLHGFPFLVCLFFVGPPPSSLWLGFSSSSFEGQTGSRIVLALATDANDVGYIPGRDGGSIIIISCLSRRCCLFSLCWWLGSLVRSPST